MVQGRRQWLKVHLARDAATPDIPARELTPSSGGDGAVLPDVLDQLPEGEGIGTVTADGACDSQAQDRQLAIQHKKARWWIGPGRRRRCVGWPGKNGCLGHPACPRGGADGGGIGSGGGEAVRQAG